jgi:hypothetical protein
MMDGHILVQTITGLINYLLNIDNEVKIEYIKIIPNLLFYILLPIALVIVAVLFYDPIKSLIPKVSSFKASGIEITFIKEELTKAAQKSTVNIPDEDLARVLRRAEKATDVLKGAQVLWVDDRPDTTLAERNIFKSWGVAVDLAWSTEQAMTLYNQTKYDVIISDISRKENGNVVSDAGLQCRGSGAS